MNIFEDFIEELKEENLLEQTVTKQKPEKVSAEVESQEEIVPENLLPKNEILKEIPVINKPVELNPKSNHDADYFRKKASNEVSFLQMVEYVVAGIERDQLKIIPQPYDDLEVKKALHTFLQVSQAPDSPEHVKAQFQLLHETEEWHSALSRRDDRIMPAHLRRYLEASRPPLSSAALLSLAKFYRNSSYNEQVRSKYDLTITRLFSKEVSKGKREVVFRREQLSRHLAELYADWSSIPLYSVEPNNPKMRNIIARFDEFMLEADHAETFDELIKEDFFKRLQGFKESAVENFFSPSVIAVAVECNVRIGNRYIQLLAEQKKKDNEANLQNRVEITPTETEKPSGKTHDIIELLKQKSAIERLEKANQSLEPPKIKIKLEPAKKNHNANVSSSAVNKWLIMVPALIILVFLTIYLFQ